jgi:hypothetical protein
MPDTVRVGSLACIFANPAQGGLLRGFVFLPSLPVRGVPESTTKDHHLADPG